MPFQQMEHQNLYQGTPEQKIFYIDRGEKKEALFFIHGWQQNARECFGYYIDNFQHYYRVLAIDLPGHGKSYKSADAEYSLNVAVKACEQAINQLSEGTTSITIIGHSMGSFLAMKLALHLKKKVDQLVLISPVMDFTPYEKALRQMMHRPVFLLKIALFFRALLDKYPFGDRKQIYDTSRGQKIPGRLTHYKFKMANHPLHASLGYMRSMIGTSLLPLVKNNHLPTLLIYGSEDTLTPAEYGSSLASLMPRAVMKVVPGGGHNVNLTQKDRVFQMIHEFIQENKSKKSGWRNLMNRFRRR